MNQENIKDFKEERADTQTTKPLWFKRKLYGFGWTPATWQGWLVILVWFVLVMFFALTVDENSSTREIVFTFLLPITLLTFTLIRFCYKFGEKPRWQWGPDNKSMKETMHFEILVNAPVKKVWEIMLGVETYKEWTAVFEPTSYYEGSWDKGSKIKFLGSGGSGMVSEIADNILYKFISIKHLGEVQNGIEDTTSEKILSWLPSYENYTFTDNGNKTLLSVDMEMPGTPEAKTMKEMFEGMWPEALLKLKEICER